jgi:hypothetical protein
VHRVEKDFKVWRIVFVKQLDLGLRDKVKTHKFVVRIKKAHDKVLKIMILHLFWERREGLCLLCAFSGRTTNKTYTVCFSFAVRL